jgi:spermidine/putrescine transport system permease protein
MARLRNHWRGPWILRAVTWAYLVWSFLPLMIAVRASFTAQPLTNGAPAGWSLAPYRQVFANPDSLPMLKRSLVMAIFTVLIAVPMGAAAGIAIGRRSGRSTTSLTALILVAVAIPQILLSTNLFFLAGLVHLAVGPVAQLIGHVTVALPFVILVVLLRVRSIHPEQEESAADLGASPLQAIRRALIPALTPALLAAASVAFVLSYDNFVVSQMLCIETARCETVPMSLFGRGGVANPGAASYALATLALGVSVAVVCMIALGWISSRPRTGPSPSETG